MHLRNYYAPTMPIYDISKWSLLFQKNMLTSYLGRIELQSRNDITWTYCGYMQSCNTYHDQVGKYLLEV